MFDPFVIGFMCCRYEAIRPGKKPEAWKPLFLECTRCLGPRTLCSIQIGNPPPLRIWLCVPCQKAQPSLKEIILSNSMKDPLL